ncbi:MAG: hypothetical protein QM784_36785 [Polyangiaceae bacterium]
MNGVGVVVGVARIGAKTTNPILEQARERVVAREVDAWVHAHDGNRRTRRVDRRPVQARKLAKISRFQDQRFDLRVRLLAEIERRTTPVRLRDQRHGSPLSGVFTET